MIRERWNERYSQTERLWSAGPNQFVAAELEEMSPGRGLDLACGEGRNAIWLAERGWDMVGVDFSSVAIDRARRLASESSVSVDWVEADISRWSPETPFDLVLIAYLHLPPGERAHVMARARKWLVPGGAMFLVGHDVASCGVSGPDDPDLLWSPEIATESMSGLVVSYAETRERVLESGDVALDTVALGKLPV